MLRDRKIAFFIDVDNAVMDYFRYENTVEQLKERGEIVFGYVYGVSERKHKRVIADANNYGYTVKLPSRSGRRSRKIFDDRIWVDVAEYAANNSAVDTVCVISHPANMTYLFNYLHQKGKLVIAGDNLDENSAALADDVVQTIKAQRPVQKPARKKAAQPAADEANTELTETAALLKEIERLRENYEQSPVGKTVTEPAEEFVAEPATEAYEQPTEEVDEQPVETDEQQAEQPIVQPEDGDLIRRIEQLRESSEGDSDELVAEIKKLLDGLD